MDGVRLKTLVYGEKTLQCEFRIERGKGLPSHSHLHEQTGYLISGRMRFIIADERHDVEPGDSWCIPGDMEHAAEAFDDSVGAEVFSPVREEYLA